MDDLERLVESVRKIATERPDVVYSGNCYYDSGECSDGSVGCLLGQALQAIDWPIYERNLEDSIVFLLFNEGYTDDRVIWCRRVQAEQDVKKTWAECVEYADG